jgi:2-oxoglutarate dehydrogenase E2 component (dihydrolipoamide succinyltransferase)
MEGISPFPAFARVAGGKLVLVSYSWRAVPMFQKRTVSMKVATPTGEQEVTKEVVDTTIVYAPTAERSQIDLADCRLLTAAGAKPAAEAVKLPAESTPVLVLSAGEKLDASIFPLLKPAAVVLEVPPSPMPEPSHILCAVPLEHRLAQVQGDNVRLTSYAFETVYKDVQYQVEVDGKLETRVRKVAETVSKPVHESLALAALQGQTAGGEQLDAARLKTLLAKETPIMYSPYPYVDPALLEMLKPETIVLQPPGHGAPGIAPAPGIDAPAPPAPAPLAPAPAAPAPAAPAPVAVPAGVPG